MVQGETNPTLYDSRIEGHMPHDNTITPLARYGGTVDTINITDVPLHRNRDVIPLHITTIICTGSFPFLLDHGGSISGKAKLAE